MWKNRFVFYCWYCSVWSCSVMWFTSFLVKAISAVSRRRVNFILLNRAKYCWCWKNKEHGDDKQVHICMQISEIAWNRVFLINRWSPTRLKSVKITNTCSLFLFWHSRKSPFWDLIFFIIVFSILKGIPEFSRWRPSHSHRDVMKIVGKLGIYFDTDRTVRITNEN